MSFSFDICLSEPASDSVRESLSREATESCVMHTGPSAVQGAQGFAALKYTEQRRSVLPLYLTDELVAEKGIESEAGIKEDFSPLLPVLLPQSFCCSVTQSCPTLCNPTD